MFEPELETLSFKEQNLVVTLEHYDWPYDSTDMKWKGHRYSTLTRQTLNPGSRRLHNKKTI